MYPLLLGVGVGVGAGVGVGFGFGFGFGLGLGLGLGLINPAAALHPQAMVGARTDARLVNIPQSEAWARRIKRGGGAPEEVSPREVLQPMGAT